MKRSRGVDESDGESEVNEDEDETIRKKTKVQAKDVDGEAGPVPNDDLLEFEDNHGGDDEEEGNLEAELEAAFALEAEEVQESS